MPATQIWFGLFCFFLGVFTPYAFAHNKEMEIPGFLFLVVGFIVSFGMWWHPW